jgi:hypothetical protein
MAVLSIVLPSLGQIQIGMYHTLWSVGSNIAAVRMVAARPGALVATMHDCVPKTAIVRGLQQYNDLADAEMLTHHSYEDAWRAGEGARLEGGGAASRFSPA